MIVRALWLLPVLTAAACTGGGRETASSPTPASAPTPRHAWWKESVIYQVYPRSFKDTNGDGIGDLRGITQRLDYLKDLGVDILWLSPIFKSPNVDNGYDISDYRDIMTDFGNMADFDQMLAGIKARKMRVILDLVANHSSDQHPWFMESRKSKDNPYRDYYFWRPGKDGGPPNDWRAYFSGPAWELDKVTNEYYLHLFAKQQPDLNWENAKVRQEIYDMMRFWLDKGIDGFRMDVIPFISKDLSFPSYPADFDGDLGKIYGMGPRLHEYLQEMNREVLSKYDALSVGEGAGVTVRHAPSIVDETRKELGMIYHFDHLGLGKNRDDYKKAPADRYSLAEFKAIFTRWDHALGTTGWNSILLGNHDFPRMVSRFGDDGEYRVLSSKMLATLLMTLKGTPYVYQGDELGMTNARFASIAEFNDVAAVNAYKELVAKREDTKELIADLNVTSRDHARTPVQWDDSKNAGFTTGKPWLKVNANYTTINAKAAVADPDSTFHYFKQAIALRKATPTLIYGSFEDLLPADPNLFVYGRTGPDGRILVTLNFRNVPKEYTLPADVEATKVLLSNYPDADASQRTLKLRPFEARVIALK